MDLSRPIGYRDYALNTLVLSAGEPSEGCVVESISSVVGAVGYTEKRSNGDGRDASDIYLDSRRLQLRGTLYGATRADLYDRLQALRATFTPTASFTDEPGQYGYVPLSYEEPTTDLINWPTGYRTLYIRVRPLSGLSYDVVRDRVGTVKGADKGGSISWTVNLEAKDPRVYVDPPVFIEFTNGATSGAGDLPNRGDYPAPMNIMLVVAPQAKPGFFTFTGGGSIMKIDIPLSAETQIIRYNGTLKVLTIETSAGELLAMKYLHFLSETTHPLVPPDDLGTYTWTTVWSGGGVVYQTIPLATGSRIFYSEAFA